MIKRDDFNGIARAEGVHHGSFKPTENLDHGVWLLSYYTAWISYWLRGLRCDGQRAAGTKVNLGRATFGWKIQSTGCVLPTKE